MSWTKNTQRVYSHCQSRDRGTGLGGSWLLQTKPAAWTDDVHAHAEDKHPCKAQRSHLWAWCSTLIKPEKWHWHLFQLTPEWAKVLKKENSRILQSSLGCLLRKSQQKRLNTMQFEKIQWMKGENIPNAHYHWHLIFGLTSECSCRTGILQKGCDLSLICYHFLSAPGLVPAVTWKGIHPK